MFGFYRKSGVEISDLETQERSPEMTTNNFDHQQDLERTVDSPSNNPLARSYPSLPMVSPSFCRPMFLLHDEFKPPPKEADLPLSDSDDSFSEELENSLSQSKGGDSKNHKKKKDEKKNKSEKDGKDDVWGKLFSSKLSKGSSESKREKSKKKSSKRESSASRGRSSSTKLPLTQSLPTMSISPPLSPSKDITTKQRRDSISQENTEKYKDKSKKSRGRSRSPSRRKEIDEKSINSVQKRTNILPPEQRRSSLLNEGKNKAQDSKPQPPKKEGAQRRASISFLETVGVPHRSSLLSCGSTSPTGDENGRSKRDSMCTINTEDEAELKRRTSILFPPPPPKKYDYKGGPAGRSILLKSAPPSSGPGAAKPVAKMNPPIRRLKKSLTWSNKLVEKYTLTEEDYRMEERERRYSTTTSSPKGLFGKLFGSRK